MRTFLGSPTEAWWGVQLSLGPGVLPAEPCLTRLDPEKLRENDNSCPFSGRHPQRGKAALMNRVSAPLGISRLTRDNGGCSRILSQSGYQRRKCRVLAILLNPKTHSWGLFYLEGILGLVRLLHRVGVLFWLGCLPAWD